MRRDGFGLALGVGIAACLAWAVSEAPGISRRPRATATTAEPAAVEASFRKAQEARAAGRSEESLLELRERAEKGPHPGYAWFLLGEAAWTEKAFSAAVRSYRRAVDEDASVADRTSAFSSGRLMAERLQALAADPWARGRPAELSDLRYLQRRLAGGCE